MNKYRVRFVRLGEHSQHPPVTEVILAANCEDTARAAAEKIIIKKIGKDDFGLYAWGTVLRL